MRPHRLRAPYASTLLAVSLALVSACRPAPDTAMSRAAARNDTAELRRLLAQGADVNGPVGDFSPMIWAARTGAADSIRVLAAAGASLTQTGGVNGWSPLEHAVHKDQTASVRALIGAGADVSGGRGARALEMAAGYGNADIVRLLLAHGTDPHLAPGGGATVLTGAVEGAWDIDYSWRGCAPHTEVVRTLLSAAPDLRLPQGTSGRRAVAFASSKGCTEMLALLDDD